ncbi:mgsA AAA+ ATPase family protein [Mycobacterium xenopi 4042]|uniref:MgsA AAA+ ATPase family protein n=1 Tax=Mycobacterium xenopi 4042 TaxID=1299334 RepID=X8BKY7_MYCXE|nr:mgsA AAA+ ATPase family protein [Mycobacterium xenopi 4042]
MRLAAGDARRALTALEVAAEAANPVTVEAIERSLDKAAVRYDRDGDQHYDVISAFIKSVRGSDVDAALHYLARMLVAGEDPRFIARRLMILASEDIGMADPTALQTAVAAAHTVQLIGMPEAQLTLAHATVHLATAPKSNAVTTALGAAMADIHAGKAGLVPAHLRDGHYSGAAALATRWGTNIPTTTPMVLSRNNIHPMNWSAWTITTRPGTAGNAKSAAVCSGCGRSSAGKGKDGHEDVHRRRDERVAVRPQALQRRDPQAWTGLRQREHPGDHLGTRPAKLRASPRGRAGGGASDHGRLRGLRVGVSTGTVDDTIAVMNEDPGVQAGVFTFEVHPCRVSPVMRCRSQTSSGTRSWAIASSNSPTSSWSAPRSRSPLVRIERA